jgi:hypothetical protein
VEKADGPRALVTAATGKFYSNGLDPSSRANPGQSCTGSRGYLGSRSSQADRVHRRYVVPRWVAFTDAYVQPPHIPGSTGRAGGGLAGGSSSGTWLPAASLDE